MMKNKEFIVLKCFFLSCLHSMSKLGVAESDEGHFCPLSYIYFDAALEEALVVRINQETV